MKKQSCVGVLRRLISTGIFVTLGALSAFSGDTHALFNLVEPAVGPFPSDQFTVSDRSQITGCRVALPTPDCGVRPSDCDDIAVINTLDGFNLQPRITISFDGAIDLSTVTSKSVSLVEFGNPVPPRIIGINQIVWEPTTNTLYVESDEALDQHAQFALISTQRILGTQGNPVQASADFTRFINSGAGEYHDRLLAGLNAAATVGIPRDSIVVGSVFTTQSVTAVLEKIRDQIKAATPQPADFRLGPGGVRTVFALNDVASITFNRQTGDNPPSFTSAAVPLVRLSQFTPGAVAQIAFGKYISPDYMAHPGEYIPEIGTLAGTPVVQGNNEIYFNLVLPSGPKPPAGWPVAIVGHGGQNSKEDISSTYNYGASLASRGIATLAINASGRGGGPQGTLQIALVTGASVTLRSGGRGFDQNGDGVIGTDEGAAATAPRGILGQRDAQRQAVADWIQLVRVIEVGMDVDGDGTPDLDATRIYYSGGSFGGGLGIEFLAIEPRVRVGVFSYPAAAVGRNDLLRLRPAGTGLPGRPSVGAALAARTPPLLNAGGLTSIGGMAVGTPYFNENLPLRNEPPLINDVPGAMEIQELFERTEWVSQSGDAAALAPYLRKFPLPGAAAKAVLIQFGKGDQTAPPPRTTAVIRAGDLADRATYYRTDLAYAEDPTVPKDPHGFLGVSNAAGITGEIARGAQMQMSAFLASEGTESIVPEPSRFFEVPIKLPLPENIEFITGGPPAQSPVDAATYQPVLSPGTLFSIFGTTNSVGPGKQAGPGALPTTLGGIMVTMNGKPAPLLYVGPTQINGQVPYETATDGAIVQVIANGISAAQVEFAVSPAAPRIFSGPGNICIAQNEDGTLNSASNPVKAGHSIVAYLIGLGAVNPPVATGAPAPASPLSSPPGPVSAALGGRILSPTYLGLTPGSVGVGQVKLLVPADFTDGLQAFAVVAGNAVSNVCLIAVGK